MWNNAWDGTYKKHLIYSMDICWMNELYEYFLVATLLIQILINSD